MGLAAAWAAVKRGFSVDVLEAGDKVGGMAAHFDFEGLSIERFYHFCCLSDHDTLEVMKELGIADKMKWVSTKMGLFYEGELYPWGDPISLLRFPKIGPISKVRYGLQAFFSMRRRDWSRLDALNAEDWLTGWLGKRLYQKLWAPLMHFKFFEFAKHVSAAWIWQRINRVGRSRKSLFEEQLGYIEGGSETLMNALAEAIVAKGGRIHLKTAAAKILASDGSVRGVEAGEKLFEADNVISTVPTPYISPLLPDEMTDLKARYERIRNIACVCVIHKLRRRVSDKFWVNCIDKRLELPGIIEFSNLRPMKDTIVYVPYYMPQTHEKFSAPDELFVNETWRALKIINPDLYDEDRIATRVGRLKYAQPVYEPEFRKILPPVETPIKGLQIADTAFYYPEDRGVSESFRFGKLMVGRIAS